MFTETPKIEMAFNEPEIPIKNFVKGVLKKPTQNYSVDRFGDVMLNLNKPSNTIATDINRYWLDEKTLIDNKSTHLIGSYPIDYNHLSHSNPQYLIGMSVPPVMMAQISNNIYEQWLSKL
jgi:DNA (cytosine-5)-methyltransferase 1